MDSKRAAEVLKRQPNWERLVGKKTGFSMSELGQAGDMGAQALEAWAWVERHVDDIDTSGSWRTGDGWAKVYYDDGQVTEGATVYAAVLDAMNREKVHGQHTYLRMQEL